MSSKSTSRRRIFPSLPASWFITLILLFPSIGVSQTWRDTLQHAEVAGVGVSTDGHVGGSPNNAIVEQRIRFHMQNEKLQRGKSPSQVVGTTFLVTTTDDAGDGSFRQAIVDANTNPGLDVIAFNIPPEGPKTIVPLSKLPNIVDSVVIDGTTQPGFVDLPMIELAFSAAGPYNGLDLYAGNSTVRGLVINRLTGGSAIVLWTGGGNIIEGNFIGTNLTGALRIGNVWNGVVAKSPKNRIGGTTPASRNVFSGNGYPSVALIAGAGEDLVQGNYFGTDVTGRSLLGNVQEGVLVDFGSTKDTIGGTEPGARNIISGSEAPYSGITIAGHAPNSTGYAVVRGNFIGTDVTGSIDFGNGGNGIHILNAHDNLIGGKEPESRNIISGNTLPGITIHFGYSENNTVQGNYIGTDSTGKLPLGNSQVGILIDQAPNNLIGGLAPGAGNVISGNDLGGVAIRETTAFGNQIQGNFIGTKPKGLSSLPNGARGVWLIRTKQNMIGGPVPEAGNVIAGNIGDGIEIEGAGGWGNTIENNYIGTDTSGKFSLGNFGRGINVSDGTNNRIRNNRIYSNAWLGIDLKPDGVTPNDTTDADGGANTLLNFPILDSATIGSGTIRIRGRIRGKPFIAYDVDFFRNDEKHASHFGQGQTLIGTALILSGPDGKADITATFSAVVTPNQFITATATDPDGNTSEFSRALCLSDIDDDGILDCWESKDDGIDVNADNVIDLDLYAKGARPDHKDLFVEVDVMSSIFLQAGTLPLVRSAFASVKNRYLGNPDGQDGINLFAEYVPYDAKIPAAAWADPPWPQFFAAKQQFFGTDAEYSDPTNSTNILEAKRLVYRYCIFADSFGTDGNSGKGEGNFGAGGNDFMVTLGTFNPVTDLLQAGTFMHELGHTLGLRHGGGDDNHFKPNYYSVMNYVWQAPQFAAQQKGIGWKLTYSPSILPSLDERNLNEAIGLDPQPGEYDIVIVPYNSVFNTTRQGILAPGVAVDWDGSGDSSGYSPFSIDLNYLVHGDPDFPPSMGDVLVGYADWPNLVYNFRNSPTYRDFVWTGIQPMAAVASEPAEMTPEMYQYLQSLPPYGILKHASVWPTDPGENIPISTAPSRQGSPVIAGDGKGGAFIAYSSNSVPGGAPGDSSDVYVQYIDSLGRVQWQNNGVPICTAPGGQQPTGITALGDGSAIIVWQDKRLGNYEVYAQRINALGQTMWGPGGVPVSLFANAVLPPNPVVTSDLQGGAIVAWRSAQTGTYTVNAQRINSLGAPQWPFEVLIGTTPDTLRDTVVQIVTDYTGGAIIAWVDQRAGAGYQNHDIYAQRVDWSGFVQWAPEGVPLCAEPNEQDWPRLAPDGSGGAIVTWQDLRNGENDLYAQRLGADGQVQWGAGGVPISVGGGSKIHPEIAVDWTGSAIIAWMDSRRLGSVYDVYAQRVNASGTVTWQEDGVAICDTTTSGLHPAIVTDENGGAVIAYANQRGFQMDIYVQRIDSSGTTQWTKNGVPVSIAGRDQLHPVMVGNRAGGAIMTWYDHRKEIFSPEPHIYAQNITSTGGLGQDVITAVEERRTGELPVGFSLMQNYPNPFNPVTTIRYDLPRASHVTLKVYDVLGRVVTVLVDETQGAGEKSVKWDASRFATGIYLYRLSAGEFVQARKMVVVK